MKSVCFAYNTNEDSVVHCAYYKFVRVDFIGFFLSGCLAAGDDKMAIDFSPLCRFVVSHAPYT